jgi:glycine/sarcosine N-methyltransferase
MERIVFQVWDWLDERRYEFHLHITLETVQSWAAHHFVGRYRAVTPDELARMAERSGFRDVKILSSADTGFYQPSITAQAP